jgi:hypothetical protein
MLLEREVEREFRSYDGPSLLESEEGSYLWHVGVLVEVLYISRRVESRWKGLDRWAQANAGRNFYVVLLRF